MAVNGERITPAMAPHAHLRPDRRRATGKEVPSDRSGRRAQRQNGLEHTSAGAAAQPARPDHQLDREPQSEGSEAELTERLEMDRAVAAARARAAGAPLRA
jgi:hypothetical protein